uniref:Reverse transcriptase domain-containing protein n=1 Tax=Tanacetum cinerariifolium TaxID=118510 RepID=A0A6L2LGG1_TANCI|nr:hypothetical protein [Tanacetum cinerariifolium]
MAIEESKDLSSLALDELIGNLKVHEVVMEKDSESYKGKKERVKSIALKAKKESTDDETLTSGSDDEEYVMDVGNFKSSLEERVNLFDNQKKKRSHFDKEIRIKERVTRNVLDVVTQIISLVIVQNHLATKIKMPSLEVLGEIAKMTPKTKPMMKLVSWLNRRMSANSLREMLNNQKSPSCKIGLGFDSDKASTSETKTMSFVGSFAEKGTDRSTIKVHGSTLPGSVYLRTCLELDEWIKDSGCSKHMTGNFWCTASVKTLNKGEIELNAIVDGQDKTITEASVKRHLKLADADGISTLPTIDIFEQLALIGHVTDSDKLTFQKDKAITKEMHDGLGRATTTASSLEAEQGSGKVTTLENKLKSTKVVYNKALFTLTKRVKKLEKKLKHKRRRVVVDSSEDEEASLDKEDSPKQGRMIEEINKDENTNLVKSSKQGEVHETTRRSKESGDTEVVDFSTASPKKDDDEETLAETLVSIKKSAAKDKGKAIMQESEPLKTIKKKEMIQISLDEEIAQRFYEEEQAQLLMDEEYAQQVQDQWMLATKRAEEKRNKPPAQAQQRTYMSNYIKNMGGYTLKQLKQYAFEEIKMLFDQTMKSIRNFVPMESEDQIIDSKAREGSSKEGESLKRPAEEESGHEHQKKQRVEEETIQQEDIVAKQVMKESFKKVEGRLKTLKAREDNEKRQKKQDDLKNLHLWTIWKLFMILKKADGSYNTYIFFNEMLNDFDKEDLIVLYRLFNEKIHSLMLGEVSIHMLVKKKYPLPQDTLTRMLQWKLHVNYNVTEMAYELLREDCWELNVYVLSTAKTEVSTANTILVLLKVIQEMTKYVSTAGVKLVLPVLRYSNQSRAYRVFNKRTRVIMESIHVNFDELPLMALDQISSDPAPECQTMVLEHDSLSLAVQHQANVSQADRTVTASKEMDFLFSPLFDELLNGSSKVVSKSSTVSAADAPNQRQQYITPLNNHTTPAPTYHPLEQVIGNPSQSVRTRRQLESDAEMCMFVLTEELHQFDRLDVWELVDRPLCINVINLKWLWKNKRDEENTVIRNKSRLVAKGVILDLSKSYIYSEISYICKSSCLLNIAHVHPRIDNATKDEDPKCWLARYQITRRGNGLVEVKGVEDLGKENVRNVLVNGNQAGCSYKEFLACNPKEYDAKRGAVVLTRWIKKTENVQDMSGCSIDQKVKHTIGSFVGKDLTWWNSQICTLSQEVAVSISWNDIKAGHVAYTDRFHELARLVPLLVTSKSRMIKRNGLIKKVKKKGNVGEPSKANSGRDDNKRTNVFATTMNPVGKENTDYRGVPRNVNHVNTRNPPVRGRGIQENQARDRAFMLGAKEARQDPNIMTGTKEPSELGFRFETEIASGQLVEIDKVIKCCKLEIEGHVFDINLIPFGYGSFDVIIGNFIPLTPDLYFTSLDEFANKPVVKNSKAKSSEKETKVVRNNDDDPIIKE